MSSENICIVEGTFELWEKHYLGQILTQSEDVYKTIRCTEDKIDNAFEQLQDLDVCKATHMIMLYRINVYNPDKTRKRLSHGLWINLESGRKLYG